jgi:Protein of unknwon function (DUF3310)
MRGHAPVIRNKVYEILKDTPLITPERLSVQVGCSVSYAIALKKKYLGGLKPQIVEKHYLKPLTAAKPDNVNHPAHYKVGGIETIDFIEAKGLNYNLGNVVKYISRADHKGATAEDLHKARWYLNREIRKLGNIGEK